MGLTEEIPEGVSEVVGGWILAIEDEMPHGIRNSDAWKNLLPLAAWTGRQREPERLAELMHWMFRTVLPQLQPAADRRGFGIEWRTMWEHREPATAWDPLIAGGLDERSQIAAVVEHAAHAAAGATQAVRAAETDKPEAYRYAAREAALAGVDAAAAANGDYWRAIDPVAVLRRLVEVR
jgi:hypothetical protein